MTTPTRTAGTWHNALPETTATTPAGWVTDALGSFGGDYDTDALTAAFVAKVNQLLPDGVTLAGDQVYADADSDPEAALADVASAVGMVDFAALAAWHVTGVLPAVLERTDALSAGTATYTLTVDGHRIRFAETPEFALRSADSYLTERRLEHTGDWTWREHTDRGPVLHAPVVRRPDYDPNRRLYRWQPV